jgi:hypothetical protein
MMTTDDPIPRNISVLLRLLRELQGHSLRTMADQLNSTPGRKKAGKNSGRVAKFDHDAIDALENQERLKIWQLGRYANWTGMPGGAIILFAQLASHLRDGEKEDVELTRSIAEAVKLVCDYVIANADQLAAGPPDNSGASAGRDKRFEKLVRECAYKSSDEGQKLEDARLIFALHQILDRYTPEAKALYQDHSRKKFSPDASEA